MICEKCGTSNEVGAKFCARCGNTLPNDGVTVGPVAPVNNPAQVVSNPTPMVSSNPMPTMSSEPAVDEHVTTKQWLGYLAINLIPFVGSIIFLVMLFLWAFGDTPKKSLKSWAKAQLIFMAIMFGLAIILVIIVTSIGLGSSSRYY